jgi:hypothetical protein
MPADPALPREVKSLDDELAAAQRQPLQPAAKPLLRPGRVLMLLW